ncbi:MAG: helix-turn-helix transcriptional regulator [Prolixibacteraceae bacterium]|nr:helix-turn-helix transcriptional regulator [Prolixibacteraceae bacterium]
MAKCLINNNIRTLRFMANEMTQQELADRTGVTRQTIVAIENGKYSPTLELAFRISHIFGKPLNEVFSFQYDEDPVLNKKIEDKRSKTKD